MADLTKLDIGVCSVTHNNVDLGETDGGVKVSIKKNVSAQTVDRFGKMPVSFIDQGDEITIEANLAEYAIENLAVALPSASLQSGTNGKKLVMGKQAGSALADYPLVLHPTALGSSDHSKDWNCYKAVVIGDIDVEFTPDKKKVFKIKWQLIPDDTKTDGNKLCHFGVDPIS